jgi:hypothetical protein
VMPERMWSAVLMVMLVIACVFLSIMPEGCRRLHDVLAIMHA